MTHTRRNGSLIDPRAGRVVGALALLLVLGACSKQVLHASLDEREANEQVALLRNAGIEARKEFRDKAHSVSVSDADFARAVTLLQGHGLPRKSFETRCKLFVRQGFVTTPAQEHELRVCAIAQEISRSLTLYAEVFDANVVLDMAVKNPLTDKPLAPKASVVVRFRPGTDVDLMKSKIRQTVAGSVEGLSPESVSVDHSVAEAVGPTPPRMALAMASPAEPSVWMGLPWPLVLTFALGLVALIAALLFALRQRRGAPAPLEQGGGVTVRREASEALATPARGALERDVPAVPGVAST
jgi:type III secretion protein J